MPKTTNNPLTERSGVSLNTLLTAAVAIIAILVIGGIMLFSGNNGSGGAPATPQLLQKKDSNAVLEAPQSKVTVVEFLDYQCGVCSQYYDNVTSKIEQQYEGQITFVTRNYPITKMHPLAESAATTAEAAAMQGKYVDMYHALYNNWGTWAVSEDGKEPSSDEQKANQLFEQYAQQIGLDVQKFRQDRASEQVRQRINQDVADADMLEIPGTPTIFINGEQFNPPSQNFSDIHEQLTEEIDAALAK